ncbi:MAG: recombinase family protein [Desulfobulbus sp.]|jgi:putative DNA-invertase from lambdoid prophage Rac
MAGKITTQQPGKVYGYARISTDKQDLERQKKDIYEYAAKHSLTAPKIVEETISSRNGDRQIFKVVDTLEKGDVLIVTELSRLARSMVELSGMIAQVLQKGAVIHVTTSKPLDDSIESQCLVFALGLAAQIERDMISERTRSGLKARKAAGVKLGRPKGKGRKVDQVLKERGLSPSYLIDMAQAGLSTAKIAKLIDLDARTVGAWLKAHRPAQQTSKKAPTSPVV